MNLLQVNGFSASCNKDYLQQKVRSLPVHKKCQNTKHAEGQRLKSQNTAIFQARLKLWP